MSTNDNNNRAPGSWPGKLIQIDKISFKDTERYMKNIKECQPILFDDFPLAQALVGKWTLDYLQEALPSNYKADVKKCSTEQFLYCDEKPSNNSNAFHFENKVSTGQMTISEFRKTLKQNQETKKGFIYLQEGLTDRVGMEILKDFKQCRHDLYAPIAKHGDWGEFGANTLWIGQKGCVTPFHFDEQHNLYCQLVHRKRIWLVNPLKWSEMKPYPVGHPADRQSELDDTTPEASFSNIEGMEIILEPGQVLYMPRMWWHRLENLEHESTSLSFWWKEKPVNAAAFVKPLTDPMFVINVRRNLERLLISTVSGRAAAAFWKELDEKGSVSKLSPVHQQALMLSKALLNHVLYEKDVDPFLELTAKNRFKSLKLL